MAKSTNPQRLEKNTRRFLKKLGFKHVDGGPAFVVGGRQVDACGGHEATLLIVECTTQKNLSAKIDSFRGGINDVIHGFRTHETYKIYERVKLVLAIEDQSVTEAVEKRARLSKHPEVYIWDDRYTSYYRSLQQSIGDYAKYSLLAELGIAPEQNKEAIVVPAFRTTVGIKRKYDLFSFFVDASDFMKVAYVARRESGGINYYQRMINRRRLTEIAKYIEKGNAFPNSIVVALDDGSWQFKGQTVPFETPNWLDMGILTIGNSYQSCWVIDGQHRLFSHAHTTVKGRILVSAFAKITENAQARYFLDINREAKPVSSNLLWDLLGTISPGTSEGILSNTAKVLRSSKNGYFEDNIKIPSLGKGNFSINNICVALESMEFGEQQIAGSGLTKIKNPFWNKDPAKTSANIARALEFYFRQLFGGLTDKTVRRRLETDGFVYVNIELYKALVSHLGKKPSNEDVQLFLVPVVEYLNTMSVEEANTIRRRLSSNAGKIDFREALVIVLHETYDKTFAPGLVRQEQSLADKIAMLELDMNAMVNDVLSERFGKDWIDKYLPKEKKSLKSKAELSEGEPWQFLNFLTTVNNLILNDTLWGACFKPIFQTAGFKRNEIAPHASRLWDYRTNKIGHVRPKPVIYSREEENLVQSIYNMFRRLLAASRNSE